MTSKPRLPRRQPMRLKDYDYTKAGAYFVTICTHRRQCIFGEVVDAEIRLNDFGRLIEKEWLQTAAVRPSVEMDYYMVMPNHFHAILFLRDASGATHRVAPTKTSAGLISGSVGAIIAQFKSKTAKQINALRRSPVTPVWQRNYYEHVIRDEDDLNRIRQYIEDNPARWLEDENYPGNP